MLEKRMCVISLPVKLPIRAITKIKFQLSQFADARIDNKRYTSYT